LVANKAATPEKRTALPPVVYVIGAVLLLGLAGFFYLDRASKRPPEAPPPLTGPAKEYVRYLRFVSADGSAPESPKMEAHESYLKQSVVEITGNIQNTGDRVIELIEINCVFYDPGGNVILRERVPIVSRKMGKLAPRETKAFRLAFDNVPDSWNQVMPSMVIARIDFS
jgi:hypothetical protein